jgi:hypothetical protein
MDGEHENEVAQPGLSAVWREWIAPVAVAGAVALALAGTIELIDDGGTTAKAEGAKKAEHGADRPATQPLQAATRGAAPGFVVAVQRSGAAVVVRDIASGATIDETLPPPAGQRFHQVAAAPDGSYLLSGYRQRRVAFYRLRLSGAGRARAFTPLPRAISGVSTTWSDMAVSADGDRVAYVTYEGKTGRITVISLRSGAHRTWRASANGRLGSLSWAGNTVSFVWTPSGGAAGNRAGGSEVRLLDTTRPGGDLRVSRTVLRLPGGGLAAVISRDGRSIVTGTNDRSRVALAAFSAATGRQVRVLRRFPAGATAAAGVTTLALDGTGRYVLAATGDGRLYAGSTPAAARLSAADVADLAW